MIYDEVLKFLKFLIFKIFEFTEIFEFFKIIEISEIFLNFWIFEIFEMYVFYLFLTNDWPSENPHWMGVEHTHYSQKVNDWTGIVGNHIIGPLSLEALECDHYLAILKIIFQLWQRYILIQEAHRFQ